MPQTGKKSAGSSKQGKSKQKNQSLRITDTTLRDAHQSLWATRMRTKDIIDILEPIDNAGYYSLEVWGGATFDVCLRFLRENPWERLRLIKSKAKNTPLQMLLRGQNILGYKNYPDDLLDRFVALACKNGIDIFRIFDALNDNRNLEYAIKSVKKHGGHAQGTLCYTISPVHTVQEYVRVAKEQEQIGVDSLCIKDMAGILSPVAAEKIVSALVKEVNVPVQLHCHMTSGMAVASYLEAAKAGAGAIDCAISPMSGFSSQPPVETMLSILDETPYSADLDVEILRQICKYFTELTPKRKLANQPLNIIDPGILIHHIPGGMISNLRSQLDQQDALDRLPEVLDEIPRTRKDMGYPPLVTPTSQIVGIQSVMNVLSGERYSMIPQETKNYVKGFYGRPPAEIDPQLRKKILGDEKPITTRPADLLDPMLPNATDNIDPALIKEEEDIISYCLFPETAKQYFEWRNLPEDERPPPPADTERKKEETENRGNAVDHTQAASFLNQADYKELHEVLDKVKNLGLDELTIRRGEASLSLSAANAPEMTPAPEQQATAGEENAQDSAESAPAHQGPVIEAPLNGTFYTCPGPGQPDFAAEGDTVDEGEPVCIVEAMKLFNQIKAPFNCRIKSFLVNHGDDVRKGQPLAAIEKV
jgi:oxaloacetate decarboxylase alpha subunit